MGCGATGGLALSLSLSVEALWRSGDRWACGIVGLGTFGIASLIPAVLAEPSWNPNFGFCFMFASIILAWVIASGSFGWWTWLVAFASVAVQTEAFFVFFALGLVVGAPVIGLIVRRPERWRWFDLGIAVGAVCWLPTVIQQATGTQRNLSMILTLRDSAVFRNPIWIEEPCTGRISASYMGEGRSCSAQLAQLLSIGFHSVGHHRDLRFPVVHPHPRRGLASRTQAACCRRGTGSGPLPRHRGHVCQNT